MKRIVLIIATGLLTMSAYAQHKINQTPAQSLIERLERLQKVGVMFGGDYPAVLGCELGGLELGNEKNLDGVPFDKMRQEIIKHYQNGGIVTISWHPYNPVTGKDAWNTGGDAVKEVLPGGREKNKMKLWHE